MLTLVEYKKDPCGVLSIPYWKNKGAALPPGMKIIHDRDYKPELLAAYTDEPYFRLFHSLSAIAELKTERMAVKTAEEKDIPLMANIINRSYADLSVSEEQLSGYRRRDVFLERLWIIAYEKSSGDSVGCGIAEYDAEASEGTLEWIQVLPEFRARGAGTLLVNALLDRLRGIADFATVSGKIRNPTRPEMLYRKCGFTGSDVWHILYHRDRQSNI